MKPKQKKRKLKPLERGAEHLGEIFGRNAITTDRSYALKIPNRNNNGQNSY